MQIVQLNRRGSVVGVGVVLRRQSPRVLHPCSVERLPWALAVQNLGANRACATVLLVCCIMVVQLGNSSSPGNGSKELGGGACGPVHRGFSVLVQQQQAACLWCQV